MIKGCPPPPPSIFVTDDEWDQVCRRRPPGYAEELAPAITRRVVGGFHLSTVHPAYVAAWQKHRPWDKPIWGRQMWEQLHRARPEFPRNAVIEFAAHIPCDQCREHFIQIIEVDHPPEDGCTDSDWRLWTVRVHNAVNRLLQKEEFTLEQAADKWGWILHPEGAD